MHDERRNVECRRSLRQHQRRHVHAARAKRVDEVLGIDAFFVREPAHVALPSLRRRNERDALHAHAAPHRNCNRRTAAGMPDGAGQRSDLRADCGDRRTAIERRRGHTTAFAVGREIDANHARTAREQGRDKGVHLPVRSFPSVHQHDRRPRTDRPIRDRALQRIERFARLPRYRRCCRVAAIRRE